MKILLAIILIVTLTFVSSVGMSTETSDETLKGGGIGALAGTAIGAIAGHTVMGLAIGAVAGAGTGYLHSKHKEHEEAVYQQGYNDGAENR